MRSTYEGWKIAFNGMDGRIEAWLDIPYFENSQMSQAALHAAEMNQGGAKEMETKPLILHKNWNDFEPIKVSYERKGHGGGDQRLQDSIFKNPDNPDPLSHGAGLRDGAMSILIGIAARRSIEEGKPIQIEDLTDLEPQAKRI